MTTTTGALRMMTARYRGTCMTCEQPIAPGDEIAHAGRGLSYHAGECADARDPDAVPARSSRGRSARSYRGAHFRGRCEDAPCCGCCGPY